MPASTDRPGTVLSDAVFEVRPGDQVAVERVEGWFREYAAGRDPGTRHPRPAAAALAHDRRAGRAAARDRGGRLRYCQDLSQDEIAARVGYSQMHVSRLLRRALDRLRDQLLIA